MQKKKSMWEGQWAGRSMAFYLKSRGHECRPGPDHEGPGMELTLIL
jgi:hypothetical protein